MKMRMTPALVLLCAIPLAGCDTDDDAGTTEAPVTAEAMQPALDHFSAERLLQRIEVLSHDSMEGRAPGTAGEERTVRYLENEFRAMGLSPGNPDGTYVQQVPLVEITPRVSASLTVNGQATELQGVSDYIASSRRVAPEVMVEDSDLVFVGYGIVAPEYDWDDYKDVDVSGKTIVMLVNDPGYATQDEALFRGNAMTYYGRWTYKYEIAAEKGAAAAIVIHETGPAGYPFEVLSSGHERPNFDIQSPDNNMSAVAVQAWMPEPAIRRFLSEMGHDFDELKQAALQRDFRPVELGGQASFELQQQFREIQSRNVIAKLEGGARADEYVVYTAHWDHLGIAAPVDGDSIYNGALDNASGTATIVEIAEAFTRLDHRPERSILFLAVTAEERGLLGAKYYAENPLYPLARTVANINVDGINQWGRTEDIVVVGRGNSTLDDVLAEAAATQGRRLEADPEPEKGFYYRSDHFEFAKQGVPALYIDAGTHFMDRDAGYGQQKRDEYTTNDYHKPSDIVKPDWDLSGAIEDARILFQVGYRVAQRAAFPEWAPQAEFRATREAMLRENRP
ncbi:MAG TPA: M28 family peptidase [Longimicrobiales bacterium]|nr:M28 family peptidase [Longimicrobiales bacterium]